MGGWVGGRETYPIVAHGLHFLHAEEIEITKVHPEMARVALEIDFTGSTGLGIGHLGGWVGRWVGGSYQ